MTDIFATPETGLQRDRHDRPLIIQPDGSLEPYTRASTLASYVEGSPSDGLAVWKASYAVEGIIKRPDLFDVAAGEVLQASHDDRKRLYRVTRDAWDAAGVDALANFGTATHTFTEIVDGGGRISDIPPSYRERVEAYRAALDAAGLDPVAIERFCVNDDLRAAGTFDRLLRERATGRIYVGDIKSGKDAHKKASKTAVQCSTYAGGSLYDVHTGQRWSMPEMGVDQERAVLIAIPLTGGCTLYDLDLEHGRRGAELASQIRDWQTSKQAKAWAVAS